CRPMSPTICPSVSATKAPESGARYMARMRSLSIGTSVPIHLPSAATASNSANQSSKSAAVASRITGAMERRYEIVPGAGLTFSEGQALTHNQCGQEPDPARGLAAAGLTFSEGQALTHNQCGQEPDPARGLAAAGLTFSEGQALAYNQCGQEPDPA